MTGLLLFVTFFRSRVMFRSHKKRISSACAEKRAWISSYSDIASITCTAIRMDIIIFMIVEQLRDDESNVWLHGQDCHDRTGCR